jgi:hypothetical protein
MALRRERRPDPPCGCGCAALALRLDAAEATIAALARFAVRDGGGADVYQLPGNRVIDSRADAAVIRTAAKRGS